MFAGKNIFRYTVSGALVKQTMPEIGNGGAESSRQKKKPRSLPTY